MSDTLVLGVGNVLLTDDGAGVYAMRRLRDTFPRLENTRFIDAGTLSFVIAPDFGDANNLIVFDAADLGAAPGTVACFINNEMDDFLYAGSRSVHEVGLSDIMDFSRLLESIPPNRALIGIQPDIVEWGEYPSELIRAAIPRAIAIARNLIEVWTLPPLLPAGVREVSVHVRH